MPVGKEFVSMYNETTRFVVHALLLHFISSIDGGEKFLDEKTLKNILFIMIAVIIYHLFVKKIIRYLKIIQKKTSDNNRKKPL